MSGATVAAIVAKVMRFIRSLLFPSSIAMGIIKTQMTSLSALNVLQHPQKLRMYASHCFSIILCQLIWVAGTQSAWLGPTFPAPRDLTSDTSIVAASWANVTSAFNSYIAGNGGPEVNGLSDLNNFMFYVNLFSLHDAQAARALQFHHTGPDVSNATTGVTQVDGDSIYRIGSITKVFTVLAGLLNLDGKDWDRPITDFVPGIGEFACQTNQNLVNVVQWEKVTLRALSAQLGGVPRDSLPYDDDLIILGIDPVLYGLPPLNLSDPSVIPSCRYDNVSLLLNCPEDIWAKGARSRPPILLPWASPAYANLGFILLGLAIANITGKPLAKVASESIFNPIGMTSSSYLVPTNLSSVVIPGGNLSTGFANDGGTSIGSGGMLSTLNDLSKFGVAVLNSTLLPPEETRRWLKPLSHTASLTGSVGAPWEIIRYTQPVTGAITDIYSKAGDSIYTNSILILLPDHGAGLTVLVASTTTQTSRMRILIADFIVSQVLPALESQAAYEAQQNCAGTYKSNTPGLNSSITLALNTSYEVSGLHIESWISNSTDMLQVLNDLSTPGVRRLLPLISGSREMAFRSSVIRSPTSLAEPGPIGKSFNSDWIGVDATLYGGKAFDHFIFELDEDGTAMSITPVITRAQLEKIV